MRATPYYSCGVHVRGAVWEVGRQRCLVHARVEKVAVLYVTRALLLLLPRLHTRAHLRVGRRAGAVRAAIVRACVRMLVLGAADDSTREID